MSKKGLANNKAVVYVLLVTYSLIWGFSFVGTTAALVKLTPMEVLAARWTLGAVIIGVLSLAGVFKVSYKGKPVKLLMVCAFAQPVVYGITENYGIAMTTASEAAIIIALTPLVVLLVSTLFLKMKIDGITKFAIVLGFAGVLCTVVFADDFSLGGKMAGYFVLLITVISSATFLITSNKLSSHFAPIERTLLMAVEGSVVFNALVLIQEGNLGYVKICFTDMPTMGAVFFLGFGCTFLCYIFCNIALSNLPAHIVSAVQANLVTLTGAVSGIIMNGDPWGVYTIVGLVMMMISVVLVNRPKKA